MFDKMLAPLRNRIINMVGRAVVQLVDDSKKLQLVQLYVLDSEVRANIERFQNYGFTSFPKADAEAVVLFAGGRRDLGLCIAVDDRRYRLVGMAEGEVAVYDQTGSRIHLKANGDIEIVPSSGNVQVTGTLTASVDVIGGGKSLKNHVHSVAGGNGAGAVVFTPVAGQTGAPV